MTRSVPTHQTNNRMSSYDLNNHIQITLIRYARFTYRTGSGNLCGVRVEEDVKWWWWCGWSSYRNSSPFSCLSAKPPPSIPHNCCPNRRHPVRTAVNGRSVKYRQIHFNNSKCIYTSVSPFPARFLFTGGGGVSSSPFATLRVTNTISRIQRPETTPPKTNMTITL